MSKFFNVKWPGTPGEIEIDIENAGPKVLIDARALWLDDGSASDTVPRAEYAYDARTKRAMPVKEFLALQAERRRQRGVEFARHFERRKSLRSHDRRERALEDAPPILGWSGA